MCSCLITSGNMVILYSKSCEGCSGNHALTKVKQVCAKKGIEFQERRVIFWDRWEKEANEIIELNEGLKLPFFYNIDTGSVLVGNSLTPLDTIENWLKKDKTNE